MKAKMEPKPKLTRAAGISVADNRNRLVAGPRGPGLLSARRLFIAPTMNPNPASEGSRSTFTDQVNQHS